MISETETENIPEGGTGKYVNSHTAQHPHRTRRRPIPAGCIRNPPQLEIKLLYRYPGPVHGTPFLPSPSWDASRRAGQTRPNLLVSRAFPCTAARCCIKTRCWLVHLLRRYFISFIFSPSNIWKIVRFLPQFMLPPFQKRKKPSNDPRPPQHPNLLLLGNPCLLMDKEMDGSQRLRRTMVRFSCSSFERFLPPSTSRRRRCLPRMPHCTISGRYGSEEGMIP
jgi:hypothetical protein